MAEYTQEQREQAARVMDEMANEHWEDGIVPAEAFRLAASVLREPAQGWVRTSERLPTEADAGPEKCVVRCFVEGKTQDIEVVEWYGVHNLEDCPYYWMPIPPLPEVEV